MLPVELANRDMGAFGKGATGPGAQLSEETAIMERILAS